MENQQQNTGIKYIDRAATPLKFHKFTWFVTVPLGFLAAIGGLISTLPLIADPFVGYYASIDALYDGILLVLFAMCFIGFFSWKNYSWYAIMIYLCVDLAYNLYAFIVNINLGISSFPEGFGSLIGAMLYIIPVFIYYKKRKRLFSQCSNSSLESNLNN